MHPQVPRLTEAEKMAKLTERERTAYEQYLKLNRPPLGDSVQLQFFQLFLNGLSCIEIAQRNRGYPLGSIVRCRIENDWDQQLIDHRAQLMDRVRERVQQIQMETVERISHELAASNKLIGEKALRYLQTGDTTELAGTSIGGLKHLKELMAILMALTGQDNPKNQQPPININVNTEAPKEKEIGSATTLPALPAGKPLTPADAALALQAINKNRQ